MNKYERVTKINEDYVTYLEGTIVKLLRLNAIHPNHKTEGEKQEETEQLALCMIEIKRGNPYQDWSRD